MRVHVVRKRLNEDLQQYGGSYAHMAVLVKLGYDEALVRDNCIDTWTDPDQTWVGVQYRIKVTDDVNGRAVAEGREDSGWHQG